MKKVFSFFCKLAISALIAMVILSVFALVYYNPPRAAAQPDKYTNSKFVAGSYWSDMTEGIGYGKTNDLGYNEADAYNADAPLVAIIGSSHTEALQIPQKETYTVLLQEQLHNNGKTDVECLNLGKSGHFFNISVSNFEYFADYFPNVECAVIETSNLHFTEQELENMLAGEYHKDMSERGGLYALAQKVPYLRLLYKQYQDSRKKESGAASAEATPFDYDAYAMGVDKVMQKISGIASEKEFSLVILYHSSVQVQNGKGSRVDDPQQVEIFRQCCEQNGIRFVDVTEQFVEHFNNTYELPYGFSNTTMGTGHLNTLGHSMIADALYGHVTEIMEGE